MSITRGSIIFLDNTINQLFQTVEVLKQSYSDIHFFTREEEFREFIKTSDTDLVFINLDLHPNDAVTILTEIKSNKTKTAPFVIIYSEKQDDFVQELAFNSGADGFIGFHRKPSIMTLFIKNLLRRKVKIKTVRNKMLFIDHEKFLVFHNNVSVQLAKKEFLLFELLYNQAGKFFSKQEIATTIWGDEKIAKTRSIDVHVYNIRQFFGKNIINTQKGKGYRLNKKAIG